MSKNAVEPITCFFFKGERFPVPLKSVGVSVTMTDGACVVDITHEYFNDRDEAIETTYVFPVPPKASVLAFESEIGGKRIVTHIAPRSSAKTEYEAGVAEGRAAAILEYAGNGDFRAQLGNIGAKSSATTKITYALGADSTTVAIDGHGMPISSDTSWLRQGARMVSAFRVAIPTAVAPRYHSLQIGGAEVPQGGSPPPVVADVSYRMKFEARVSIGKPGEAFTVHSPTHGRSLEIAKESDSVVAVRGKQLLPLDGDLVLLAWSDAAAATGKRFVGIKAARTADRPDECALMMTVLEPHVDLAAGGIPGYYVLVVDRSGSMQGDNIRYARAAAKAFVRCVPKGSAFDIVAFDSTHDVMLPERKGGAEIPRAASGGGYSETWLAANDSVAAADAFIDANVDARGGTEVLPALIAAYRSIFGSAKTVGEVAAAKKLSPARKAVLLITDGQFDYGSRLTSVVEAAARDGVKTFTVGIGTGASEAACYTVAYYGMGDSDYATGGEDIAGKVVDQVARMASRSTYLRKFEVSRVDKAPAAPGAVVSLGTRFAFAGKAYRAYGIVDCGAKGGGKATDLEVRAEFVVEDSDSADAVTLPISVAEATEAQKLPPGTRKDWLRALAAGAKIKELEAVPDASRNAAAIEDLGTRYGVASSATSFVGVAEMAEGSRRPKWDAANPKRIDIPVQIVRDWVVRGAPRYEAALMAPVFLRSSAPPSAKSAQPAPAPQSTPAQPMDFVAEAMSTQATDGSWRQDFYRMLPMLVDEVLIGINGTAVAKLPDVRTVIATVLVLTALAKFHSSKSATWGSYATKGIAFVENRTGKQARQTLYDLADRLLGAHPNILK